MLRSILSGDYPRSRALSAMLLVIFVLLAFAPFLFSGPVAYRTASTICLFIILVASYDLLLGYTSIVSFAHTMFYGIGAYAMAIALRDMGPTWGAVAVGVVGGLIVALLVALLLGALSLRVRAIFFALVTLAVATGFMILVSKMYSITGGQDGLTLKIPEVLDSRYALVESCTAPDDCRTAKWTGLDLVDFFSTFSVEEALFNVRMTGKILMYYVVFISSVVLFLLMLRMMNSPFGRVCQAIRENEFRAEALGYRTVYYRTINVCVAAMMAALAGALTALSLKFVNPDTTLSFTLMVNILLMTVIGGMGTMYGAVVGTALFVIAQNYLQDLMKAGEQVTAGIPVIHELVSPERWYMWLGILFVLSVYFFPKGVVGQLRIWAAQRRSGKSKVNGEPAISH